MLLWELAFEKIPYDNWDVDQIKNHVLSDNRETLANNVESEDHFKVIKENYFKIIKSGK